MKDIYAVFYREMLILRKRIYKVLSAFAVSPLLFLIAFGWGMGRKLQVEGMDYISFMIPGLIGLSSMSNSFGIATDINVARFYRMTFEEFQVAPISSMAIVLGEVLSGVVRGMLAALVIVCFSYFFGVNLCMGLPFWFAVFLNAFMFASAAMVAAMLVKSHADQANFNTFFIVPMSFLCGTFFSLSKLPEWAYMVAQILPLTHTVQLIRKASVGQAYPYASLLAAILYALLFFVFASRCVRKSSL